MLFSLLIGISASECKTYVGHSQYIYSQESCVEVIHSVFIGLSSPNAGGAIRVSGTSMVFELSNSNFIKCHCGLAGGGVNCRSEDSLVFNSCFFECTGGNYGQSFRIDATGSNQCNFTTVLFSNGRPFPDSADTYELHLGRVVTRLINISHNYVNTWAGCFLLKQNVFIDSSHCSAYNNSCNEHALYIDRPNTHTTLEYMNVIDTSVQGSSYALIMATQTKLLTVRHFFISAKHEGPVFDASDSFILFEQSFCEYTSVFSRGNVSVTDAVTNNRCFLRFVTNDVRVSNTFCAVLFEPMQKCTPMFSHGHSVVHNLAFLQLHLAFLGH